MEKQRKKEDRRGRAAAKFARPVSLIFSIVLVVLAILVVVLIVAPELGRTLVNVVKKVEEDIPLAQKWLTDTFQSDSEIVKWASTIEIDPQKIIDSIVSVLRSGADNLVSSTITVTMGLVSMAMNFAIGFVFFLLCAPSEREAGQAGPESSLCDLTCENSGISGTCLYTGK